MGWGAAIAAVTDYIGSASQARDNATTAYNRQVGLDQYLGQNQMQWRVGDLKAAGINPMLAASSGLSMGMGTAGVMPAMTPSSNLAGGVSSALGLQQQNPVAAAQARNLNAQAAATEADTPDDAEDTRALATQIRHAQTSLAFDNKNLAETNIDKVVAETTNLATQGDKLRAEIANIQAANPGIRADSTISQLDASARSQIQVAMVKAALAEKAQAASSADNLASFNNSTWGKFLSSVGFGADSPAAGASSALARLRGPVSLSQPATSVIRRPQ